MLNTEKLTAFIICGESEFKQLPWYLYNMHIFVTVEDTVTS